ncbi:MAG: hypothetical protein GX605_05385 [Chloroflexi bacterium]|nr:hypothetical protein [Chloroflexota bacterium]
MHAPHFTQYVREQLETRYGPQALYKNGLRVTTTLDRGLQRMAEEAVGAQVAAQSAQGAHNAALVALNPATGEILAMVGSADFFSEEISGQINMALSPRQPGSAIKPLTYLAAFERGWSPATLMWDVPTDFPDGANPPYRPRNYDGQFRGPVLVRQALGNSLNIPAVRALQFVGLDGLKEMAARLGVTTLTRPDYGLSLTLGGGEVPLLELAAAYGVLANEGVRVPAFSIMRVEDSAGRLIEEHQQQPGQQVVSREHAFLITDVLADAPARQPAFGATGRYLMLDRPAAVKTGTTNDVRDVWTVGYTPKLVTGVWVGNADNSAMTGLSGSSGAAPIWQAFMTQALRGTPSLSFLTPPGVSQAEVCADSGTLPSDVCPARRLEWFAQGQGPRPASEDIHQRLRVDRSTGGLATEFCPPDLVEERVFLVYPPEAAAWAQEQGLPLPPQGPCPVHTHQAELFLSAPQEGAEVAEVVPIRGTVRVPGLVSYRVEYGVGLNPEGWGLVAGPFSGEAQDALLAQWETRGLLDVPHTLRLVAETQGGALMETRVHVVVQNAPPTETPTRTPRPTRTRLPRATEPLPTPTDVAPTATWPLDPTASPWPTATPEPTATWEPPVETPLPSPTLPVPVETPVPTPEPSPSVEPVSPAALTAQIISPEEGDTLFGPTEIIGAAGGPGFVAYRVEVGLGHEPESWILVGEERSAPVQGGVLALWSPQDLGGYEVTIRLTVWGLGAQAEARVLVRVG